MSKETSNKLKLKGVKAIQSTEDIIKIFQTINFRQPQVQDQQFNWLKIPINALDNPKKIENIASKWRLLLSFNEIFTAPIDPNIKHFGEAHNTSFTSDPLH